MSGAAQASFTLGDDRAWRELERIIAPGQLFAVSVNDRLRLRGRAEVNEADGSPSDGVKLRLVVRTKLQDARVASADPATKVANTTIRDFILALYRPLGFTAKDFEFNEASARDLMTGKASGSKPPVDLVPLQAEQAKVQPPETIFDAAERHLKRFHMMQWDAADGRIVIGRPDETQMPLYRLAAKRGPASVANNVGSVRRSRDWSDVPSQLTVYGGTSGKEVARAPLKATVRDADLEEVVERNGHFFRPALMPAEGAKTQAHVDAQARREMASKAQRKDGWEITTDGWSYWTGSESISWAINTTADVDIDALGGPAGLYLITRVEMRASNSEKTTRLTLASPKAWVF